MEASQFVARYGSWALIAGASEGTGASFAHQLAAKGLNLILVARREALLAALAEEIRSKYGSECISASIDLSADAAADQMLKLAEDRDVGLFISNAGADTIGSMFLDSDLATWDALVTRNVNTVLRCCHGFGRRMRERGGGGMILVGSGAGYGGMPGIGVYCATKAFDMVLGEALWAELKPHGVDVLNLIMTQTDTPAHRELIESKGLPFDPSAMATSDDVAALGLAQLPHGPVVNWGLTDDDPGYAGSSAAARRARIEAGAAITASYAK